MELKDFEQMREQIQRLMGDLLKDSTPLGYQTERAFHPPMDVYETAEQVVIILEIAGMKPDDIHVFVKDNVLSINGSRSEPVSPSKIHLHQMEIDYGSFERTLRIPCAIDVDRIKASYRDGFLMVTLPKKEDEVLETVEVISR
jgi:HSP20 family protein